MANNQDESTRQYRVDQAEQSGLMEGLELSDEAKQAAQTYVSGEIDSAELVEQMRSRYGHG